MNASIEQVSAAITRARSCSRHRLIDLLHVIILVRQHELSVVPLMSSLHNGLMVRGFQGVGCLRTFSFVHESRGNALSIGRSDHGRLIAAPRLGSRGIVHLDWFGVLVILLEH